MKGMRLAMVAALALCSLAALPRWAAAQSEVRIELPQDDPFPAAPEIFVRAVFFPVNTFPRRIRLRLALDINFGRVVYDSTMAGDEPRFGTITTASRTPGREASTASISPGSMRKPRSFT